MGLQRYITVTKKNLFSPLIAPTISLDPNLSLKYGLDVDTYPYIKIYASGSRSGSGSLALFVEIFVVNKIFS